MIRLVGDHISDERGDMRLEAFNPSIDSAAAFTTSAIASPEQ